MITIFSAPVSVFLFYNIFNLGALRIGDAGRINDNVYFSVRDADNRIGKFAIRSVSAAFSFSAIADRAIRLWVAASFDAASTLSLLIMLINVSLCSLREPAPVQLDIGYVIRYAGSAGQYGFSRIVDG